MGGRKLPEGLGVGRSEVHMLDPMSTNLIADEGKYNIARWKPTTTEQVRELAEQIVQKAEERGLKDHGQLQPVKVRKISVNEYAISAGFTRYKALRLINTHPDLRKRLNLEKGEVYPLRCEISNQNENDALLDNIDENLVRIDATDMDRSNIVAVLGARGWTDKQIAERFRWTPNWVGQLKKLQLLDESHQQLVHEGVMGVVTAIDLTDLPSEERDALIEMAANESRGKSGKINGQVVRAAKRDKVTEKAEADGTEVSHTVSRSMREMRTFFEQQGGVDSGNYDVVQNVFHKLLDFSKGKCGPKAVLNSLNALVETDFDLNIETPENEKVEKKEKVKTEKAKTEKPKADKPAAPEQPVETKAETAA